MTLGSTLKGGFTKLLDGAGGFCNTPRHYHITPGCLNDATTKFGFWRRFWKAVIVSILNIQSDRKLRVFTIFAVNKQVRSTNEVRLANTATCQAN